MPTVLMPELTQLDRGKSMIRYFPPKGYGRLRRILRQDLQAAALTAGKQHGNAVFLFKLHFVSLSFLFLLEPRRGDLVGSRISR